MTIFINGSFSEGGSQASYKGSVRATAISDIDLDSVGLSTIDGVELQAGNRVLVVGQLDQTENGIYVASAKPWLRADDVDSPRNITAGMLVYCAEGQEQSGKLWVLSTIGRIIPGQTNLLFQEYQPGGAEVDPVFLASEASKFVDGDKQRVDDSVMVGDKVSVLDNDAGYVTAMADSQEDSTAIDLDTLRQDFNALLAKLRKAEILPE